jgi:hypothetical protein
MAVIATPKEVLLGNFMDQHGPMRIRIELFISMRIRIQIQGGSQTNADPHHGQAYKLKIYLK